VIRSRIILLVEDNDDDIELTLRAFESEQVAGELVVVRDGRSALDYLFATGEFVGRSTLAMPEVVLLDLKLPGLGGLDVLRALRSDERTRRVPVVVMTSSNEEQDVVASYELGANSFVRKPVAFEAFAIAARQLGVYWLGLNIPLPLGREGRR
jgi:two-component system, response regulator